MNCEHRYLLNEARDAADPQKGMLYCYADLQELLGKVARAAQDLFEENEQMAGRLRRGPVVFGGPAIASPERKKVGQRAGLQGPMRGASGIASRSFPNRDGDAPAGHTAL